MMDENERFKRLCSSIDYYYCIDKENDDKGLTEADMLDMLNDLNDENEQLIKDNFELQGLLGDVRALLRLDKVDDAISRIDKFERSMKK